MNAGGRCWIRTNVGDADGFTDRSLWPLGQPAGGRPQWAAPGEDTQRPGLQSRLGTLASGQF
jgi:hypothetical protein